MSTVTLTTAQALLRFLSQQYVLVDGVKKPFVHGFFSIFGHGNVTGLGEALEYDNYGIKTIRGNNEQGMAHAAIAFAKQKNRLAIMPCTSSIGPGALNMVTSAGVATANRLPLLLLPGDVFADRQPDPVLQQIERSHDYTITANDAFKPVSAYWDRILRPEMLMTACLAAMRVLTSPAQTGAVTLCLAQDVQAESYHYPLSFFKERVWAIDRKMASSRAIKEAALLISQAKLPLIIAGGGVHYSDACKALADFSLKHGIAVAETQAGKSALSSEHPFNVGGIGTTGSKSANVLAFDADVILAIGTRLQDFTTASKWLYPSTKLIQLNINEMDSIKMDAVAVNADALAGLNALSTELKKYKTDNIYQKRVKALKTEWEEEVTRLYKSTSNTADCHQLAVLGTINDFVTEEDTIICAAGSLPGDLHRLWRSKKPKDYHLEYGFSCMGYEVAAGLGVTLAKESDNKAGQAYVLVGDGSFLMLHSELVTACQLNKKFTIILFDNGGYGCIAQLQKNCGSQGFCTMRIDGVQTNNEKAIDFAAYAKALGVATYKAGSVNTLKNALHQAKSETCPVLIEVKVSSDSMSHGYDSWWRVATAEVSKANNVLKATAENKEMGRRIKCY